MRVLIFLAALLTASLLASEPEYKVAHDDNGKAVAVVRADKVWIPINEKNADYRTFLEWNKKQAVPLSLADKPKPAETAEQKASKERRAAARALLKQLKAKPKEERTAEEVREAVHAIIEILGDD